MKLELPPEDYIVKTFAEACKFLGIEQFEKSMIKTVIYEMTDGMRTSTTLRGPEAYFDGGIFSLRFMNILRVLGMPACYINVIEEKHKERDNYADIFEGLKRLYPIFSDYAEEYKVKLKFIGDLNIPLEPQGFPGNFAKDLRTLERKTKKNTNFTAYFLINYSLDWAMKNESFFSSMPNIDVTIRHTKFQYPTGMMLPPSKSDFSSLVYVQQGSSSSTWSDLQLIYLVALALRSKVLNESTQYLKRYEEGERDIIRSQRESELYMVHRRPIMERLIHDIFYEKVNDSSIPFLGYPPKTKRVILAGPLGPEIYEF
jgi:hypothetical protein